MTMDDRLKIWKDLSDNNPTALTESRLQLHYAVQLAMRAGRVGLPKRPDDSHSNLDFLPKYQALACHSLNPKGLRIGIILETLTLFAADGKEDEKFELDGKTMNEASDWVKARLADVNIDSDGFDAPSYDMPPHPLDDGAAFDASDSQGLKGIAAWFHNASLLLKILAEKYKHLNPGPSPVYCWPHHFDIATLIMLEEGDPEQARSVGVGLSPGDGAFAEPYFYTSPWPVTSDMDLPDISAPGFWNKKGFTACVARGSDVAKGNFDAEAMLNYWDDTIQKSAKLLGLEI